MPILGATSPSDAKCLEAWVRFKGFRCEGLLKREADLPEPSGFDYGAFNHAAVRLAGKLKRTYQLNRASN